MAKHGFNRLRHSKWSEDERARIEKLFSGDESDWSKASLASVRKSVKEYLLSAQKYRCAYCRRGIEDEIGRVEIDHVIPKSTLPQFTYTRLNLVATCKRCNHRKNEHNPLARKSKNLVKYPVREAAFIWVHPYMHRYSEHIKIINNIEYQSVNGSPSGMAVIRQCGLATLQFVSAKRKVAIAASSETFFTAVLRIIGEFPNMSSDDVVATLKQRVGRHVPDAVLAEVVNSVKTASSKAIKKTLSKISNAPYAAYFK